MAAADTSTPAGRAPSAGAKHGGAAVAHAVAERAAAGTNRAEASLAKAGLAAGAVALATAPSAEQAARPIAPWYHAPGAGRPASGGEAGSGAPAPQPQGGTAKMTPTQTALNFALVGASCVAAQATVHWTRTTMVRQQLAGLSGEKPLGMLAQTYQIGKAEGIRGLYRGFSAAALRESTYSSLRFGLYEPIKHALGADEAGSVAVWKKVAAGLVAGAGAAAIASPTDLLMIQMAASKSMPPPTLAETARAVLAREGVAGLYKGIGTTVVRAAMLGATKMATYDVIKTELRGQGWKEGPGLVFAASAVTGLAITVTTSPATNVQTMIMSGRAGSDGMLSASAHILRTQGPVGFFRGFGMQWARFGPYAVVQFAVWESLRKACGIEAI